MKRGILFLVVFIFLIGLVSAVDLYVDQNSINGACSDSYTRATNDLTHPWCTIARANDQHIGGDHVYILPGEYRENMLPKEGSIGQHTVYSGYGARDQVFILGSDELFGWTQDSGNLYSTSFSAQETRCEQGDYSAYGTDCWEDGTTWLDREYNLGDLDQDSEFYYDYSNSRIYFYSSTGDPSSRDIECSIRRVVNNGYSAGSACHYDNSYVNFENFTFMHSYRDGINLCSSTHDINIINNEFVYNSGQGSCNENPAAIIHHGSLSSSPSPNINVIGNKVHHQGSDRGLAIDNINSGHTGAGIELYATRDSLVANNEIYSLSEAISPKLNDNNIVISNNDIHNVGRGVFLMNTVRDILIENNLFYDFYYDIDAEQGAILWRGNTYNTDNFTILHNTFDNVQVAISMDFSNGIPSQDHFFRNNIFNEVQYEMTIGNAIPSVFDSASNLFYEDLGGPTFAEGYYDMRNNLFDITEWQTATQTEDNPVLVTSADPDLFVDVSNNNFNLQTNSPAIDAGTIIPGYHCTESGVESEPGCRVWYGSAPDIGAIEYVDLSANECSEGEITSSCECGSQTYDSGFCCYNGNDFDWFGDEYNQCPSSYYYVAPDGSDATGDGTYGNPWGTFLPAVEAVGPGDVIYARGGTYGFVNTMPLRYSNNNSVTNEAECLALGEDWYYDDDDRCWVKARGFLGIRDYSSGGTTYNVADGNSTHYIAVRSYPGELAIFDNSDIPEENFIWYISSVNGFQVANKPLIIVDQKDYWIIENLEFVGGSIFIGDNDNNNTLRDIIIRNNDIHDYTIYAGDNPGLIKIGLGDSISGGPFNIFIWNNTLHGIYDKNYPNDWTETGSPNHQMFGAVTFMSREGYRNDITGGGTGYTEIINNTIYNANQVFYFKNPMLGPVEIKNNMIYNSGTLGVVLASNVHMTNNLVYNVTKGFHKVGAEFSDPNIIPEVRTRTGYNATFFNNTFVGLERLLIIRGGINHKIENNIFYGILDSSRYYIAKDYYEYSDPANVSESLLQTITSDNNCFIPPSSGLDFVYRGSPNIPGDHEYYTYSEALVTFGYDPNSIRHFETDPNNFFVDVDNFDYHLIDPDLCPGMGYYATTSSSGSGNSDVNSDGDVNIIDLALTIYWQGKIDSDGDWSWYDHLDVNSDGSVNWQDVLVILESI